MVRNIICPFEKELKAIVRSPCPMINALANHHILPHSGRGITKAMAVEALTRSVNLDSSVANIFASVAVTANPDHSSQSFDLDQLDKHGLIEHDVSLSRNDVAFGDNHTFSKEIWEEVMKSYGGDTETSFATVSQARYDRVLASKKAHAEAKKDFQYGIKEFILSYGESALFLGILGSPDEGKIPLEYLKVLFRKFSSRFVQVVYFPDRSDSDFRRGTSSIQGRLETSRQATLTDEHESSHIQLDQGQ